MNPGAGIPLPPDVAGQMPPMGQFAGQAQQAFGGGQGAPQAPPDPVGFATEALNQIADTLGKMAQVVLQVRPELAPLVQQMAEAGSQLQSQLTAQPEQGASQAPTQPEGPQDVPMA